VTSPSRPTKTSSRLSHFDQCLNMYALAATAAGVGALALAQPVEGKIVYTKTNKSIGPRTTLHLDLNHDGIKDFDLKDTLTTTTASGKFAALSAGPDQKQNAVWGHTVPFRGYASALSANVEVGPKGQFLPAVGLMAAYSVSGLHPGNFSCTGPWANVTKRYLGLKFMIGGAEHFGWARLNVSCNGPAVSATLTGYAYETVANKPILTGKEKGPDDADNPISAEAPSGTPGRLALGAAGRPGR
jgi:hypothetical protein